MDNNRFQTIADVFILIGLALVGMVLFSILGLAICMPLFNIPFSEFSSVLSNVGNKENIDFLKLFNLISTLGTWFFSVFVFLKIKGYYFAKAVGFVKPIGQQLLQLIPLVFVGLVFSAALLMQINEAIPFPDFMKNMSSAASKALLKNMLAMNNVQDLLMNLIFIALAPAVLEEIFFRGILQKQMITIFNNHHWGIFITSLLFALIHFNMEQILPMLFLAMVMGYVAHYTKSIYPSMFIHFLNNGFAVVVTYFAKFNPTAELISNDAYQPNIFLSSASLALVVAWLYFLHKNHQKTISTQ